MINYNITVIIGFPIIKLSMKKAIITDLDGTITTLNGIVGKRNISTLHKLGELGIIRIIATGRSLHSAKMILPKNFPIDYLIFSTGCGIIDWKNGQLIYSDSISEERIPDIYNYLINNNYDFMIHSIPPDTHKFTYQKSEEFNADFERRFEKNKHHIIPDNKIMDQGAGQFLVILGSENFDEYFKIKNALPDFNVIRTTSPLDNKSIWVEIFAQTVSKGHATQWLSDYLGIEKKNCLIVGNDYNDLDMLNWGIHSFIVGDAPEDLLKVYKSGNSSFREGFSDIVLDHFNIQLDESGGSPGE